MSDNFVRLTNDNTSTGKRVRTRTRMVGGIEVHEHVNALVDMLDANGDPLNVAEVVKAATDDTGAIKAIPIEHAKIHAGQGWAVSVDLGSIPAGQSRYILADVGNVHPHLREYSVTATAAPVRIRIYEGADASGGDPIQLRNRRRPGATDMDGATMTLDPTVIDDGALLETSLITGERRSGGNVGSAYEEWIANDNTKYLIRIDNLSNAASDYTVFNAFWYLEGEG